MHVLRSSARRARTLLPAALVAAAGACAGAAAPAAAPAPAVGGALPLKLDPRPTTAAITAADLMTRLYVFADDSMQGRKGGTPGNVKGTDYLAREAARIGLQPAGENGTFFQTIPLVSFGVAPGSGLSLDGRALGPAEALAVPSYEGLWTFGTELNAVGVPVVYGGRLGETLISPAQAAGKIVVFAPRLKGGQPSYRFWEDAPLADYASAAAVVFPVLELASPSLRAYAEEPATMLATGRAAPRAPVGLLLSAAAADRLFGAPLASLRPGAAGRALAGSVRFAENAPASPTRNVVALLPGSDPALRGQYVAIGAHNDHEGLVHDGEVIDHDSVRIYNAVLRPQGLETESARPSPAQRTMLRAALDSVRRLRPARRDTVYNGADDDGSGSVAVLEIAQALAAMETRPRRSILFVWHTGEELGLLGSEWFARHSTVPRDSVVAQLNIDMIGRGNADDMPARTKDGTAVFGGPDYLQLVGSRRLSTQLGDLVEQVNRDRGHALRFDYSNDADGHPGNIYCRSDHYNYARFGIPVTFFTTGIHRDYHQVTDEPQYVNYDKMARVASLIRDVALAVANQGARLVVDRPLPDPEGSCQQ